MPHTHSFGTEWKSDSTSHWHDCAACGAKTDEAAHSFKWVTDKAATATEKGIKHEECTVCGYQKEAVEIPAAGTGTSSQPGSSQNGSGGSASGNVQTGEYSSLTFWIALLTIPLAYIAGQAGWVVAECGRQPWAIRDMLPTSAAISKLDVGSVQATFFIFLILFTVMLIAEIGIMVKAIKKGPEEEISNR